MRTTFSGVLESLATTPAATTTISGLEMAHVYQPKADTGELPNEPLHLAGGLSGRSTNPDGTRITGK